MKILFLSHYCFLYGSNRSLDSLIDFFISKGENIEVLLPSRGEFFKHLEKKEVKVHVFMFLYEVLYYKWNKKYLTLPLLWLYDAFAFPFLVYKVHKISPDVVYTNSSADLFSVWIAKIFGIKHIMHVREFMEEDFGGRCVFGRNIKRAILLKSDKIICVSKAVSSAVFGELPSYGKVIYNGLPTKTARNDSPILNEHLRIGVVGNIDISKQQGLAISYLPDILAEFPTTTLHIIGDKECPYKRFILKMTHDLGLEEHVVFEGFIKNVEEIYSKFDVLLMCSRSEAFGRVTIEAMLRCKPVIGYEAGGTPELIDDGVTGFKFKNVSDVLRALETIVYRPQTARQVVENAYVKALTTFSEEAYVNNVYDYVMNGEWVKK